MKQSNPTTPGQRQVIGINYRAVLTTNRPAKSLTKGGKRGVGRNNIGQITTRHKGSGHKRVRRAVDFKYDKLGVPAKVESVEYDPNRTAFIGLVCYRDGERRYHILPKGIGVGSEVLASETAKVRSGNRLPLKNIPLSTLVYNVEVKPRGGAKFARSAGSAVEILSNDAGYTNLKLPSGEVRKVGENCWASIGAVSNDEHKLVKIGKAGRTRWLGVRPTVRGYAMNPVDHPYGGGEQRQGRGTRRAKSKWGKPTGGVKTRTPKKYSNKFIVSRRKKKNRK